MFKLTEQLRHRAESLKLQAKENRDPSLSHFIYWFSHSRKDEVSMKDVVLLPHGS